MKKWISVLLTALLLLGMTALAEGVPANPAGNTPPQSIVPIKKVHYNMNLGYALAYNENEFVQNYWNGLERFVAADDENAFMIVSSTEIQADAIDAMLNEAVGGYGPDAVIGEPTETIRSGEMDGHSGVAIKSIDAQEEGVVNRFYLVYKPTEDEKVRIEVLCITATFPAGEAEKYGAKFDALVGGIELNIPEAQYQGEGWTMWYPSDIIKPQQIYTKEGFVPVDETRNDVSMIVTLSDVAPEHVPDLLTEAMGGYVGIHAASEQEEFVTDNNMIVRWFETEQNGTNIRYYAVWSYNTLNDDVYCITAVFSSGDQNLYGAAFDRMVASFAIDAASAE